MIINDNSKIIYFGKDKACRKLQYSKKMKLEQKDNGKNQVLVIKIDNPTINMQKDDADFEAIAFCAKSAEPNLKVILCYESLGWIEKDKKWGTDATGRNIPIDFTQGKRIGAQFKTIDPDICHYARFLYRAYKMKELYADWFEIDGKNKNEVDTFEKLYKKALNQGNLFFSDPGSSSNIKDDNGFTENHLEKWFVLNTRNGTAIDSKYCENFPCDLELHDQFPCGIFYGKTYDDAKKEKNRVFNTGYFDLWGCDKKNNQMYIFELKKKGNEKLGIVSELFFYSCLMKDFIIISQSKEFKNHIQNKNDKEMFRGFKEFKTVVPNCREIKAFFLVPKFHPFITEGKNKRGARDNNMRKLLDVMNMRGDNVKHGCIWFKQDTIIKSGFIKNLIKEWKN